MFISLCERVISDCIHVLCYTKGCRSDIQVPGWPADYSECACQVHMYAYWMEWVNLACIVRKHQSEFAQCSLNSGCHINKLACGNFKLQHNGQMQNASAGWTVNKFKVLNHNTEQVLGKQILCVFGIVKKCWHFFIRMSWGVGIVAQYIQQTIS